MRYRAMMSRMCAVLLGVVWMAGCATSGVNRGDFNVVSIDDEWKLGRQIEAEIAQQMDLVTDPTVVGYIDQIGQRIVARTEMANLPWKFHVVKDPSINAFNIPGGQVYVNTGLIEKADNVAQLASVMGHEIAHGVARHATEQLSKRYGISVLASLVLGGDPSVVEQIVAQIAATGAVAKFSRDAEREADELGIRYMYEAGYNPDAMASMFEKLLQERRRNPNAIESFFATHPLTEDRIRDARRRANNLPQRSGLITSDGRLDDIQRRV